jgi:hypothetical protein
MTEAAIASASPTPIYETTNLAFAAYCHMKGLRICRAQQVRRAGALEYAFAVEDPDGKWNALRLEFANSEAAQFDDSVRTLKKLCRLTGAGGRR